MALMDKESQAAALETKRKVSAAINCRSKGMKRRRHPDEVPDIRTAVVNNCRECMGYEPGAGEGSLANVVRGCTAETCWMWPWRTGKLDPSLIKD